MSRFLLAIPLACALMLGAAGASGAFATHGANAAGSVSASTGMAGMSMPVPHSTMRVRAELHQHLVKVQIKNFAFVPARVEVSPGTRVVWTNEDSDPHTVTTDKSGFASQALNTGQTYARVLTKTGTLTYHCQIHPFMHGAVIVEG